MPQSRFQLQKQYSFRSSKPKWLYRYPTSRHKQQSPDILNIRSPETKISTAVQEQKSWGCWGAIWTLFEANDLFASFSRLKRFIKCSFFAWHRLTNNLSYIKCIVSHLWKKKFWFTKYSNLGNKSCSKSFNRAFCRYKHTWCWLFKIWKYKNIDAI